MALRKGPEVSAESLSLPKINIRRTEVTLVGDSPLIIHRWSKKAKEEMLKKQMKEALGAKEAKDPERDFWESLYILRPDGSLIVEEDEEYEKVIEKKDKSKLIYGFPVVAFKAAAVTACTSIGGITKVMARQAFHINEEYAVIMGSEPQRRQDMVRIGMGTADLRYRGEFYPWFTTIRLRHNANVLSEDQVRNMLNTSGFGVGIGEWRPERDGSMGMFHVAEGPELKECQNWMRNHPQRIVDMAA